MCRGLPIGNRYPWLWLEEEEDEEVEEEEDEEMLEEEEEEEEPDDEYYEGDDTPCMCGASIDGSTCYCRWRN